MFNELFINVTGTIIGGLILAAILFFLNEKIFPVHNISGVWNIKTVTETTTYNPYRDLELSFIFHLVQIGNEISGSGEKTKEISKNSPPLEYERTKRTIVDVIGYYKRNIFKKDDIYLLITEKGKEREARTTYILKLISKDCITGTFSSTAADSNGSISMTIS